MFSFFSSILKIKSALSYFRHFVLILVASMGLQITVDILILDFLVCKLKNTWLSGVNLLIHQTGNKYKQSTFLCLSALWLKNQVQSSPLDIKR